MAEMPVKGVVSGILDACIYPYTGGASGKEPANLALKGAYYPV